MQAILLRIGDCVRNSMNSVFVTVLQKHTLETFVILQSLAQTYVLSDKSDLMHGASLTQSIIILWIVTVQLMLRLLLLPKKAFKSFTGNSFGKKGSKYHPNFTHSLLTNFGVPTHAAEAHRSRLRPSRKFSWAKKGNNSKTYLRVIFCS